MLDTVNGAPVHPLIVHAIVVLLPLAALGTVAVAVVRRWRVPYGPLVVAAVLVSTVLTPFATQSGEALEEWVGDPGRHAELGEQLLWLEVPMLVLVAAFVWLARRDRRDDAASARPRRRTVDVLAALSVVAALVVSVQVVRVGDSGAKAVWDDPASSSAGR